MTYREEAGEDATPPNRFRDSVDNAIHAAERRIARADESKAAEEVREHEALVEGQRALEEFKAAVAPARVWLRPSHKTDQTAVPLTRESGYFHLMIGDQQICTFDRCTGDARRWSSKRDGESWRWWTTFAQLLRDATEDVMFGQAVLRSREQAALAVVQPRSALTMWVPSSRRWTLFGAVLSAVLSALTVAWCGA